MIDEIAETVRTSLNGEWGDALFHAIDADNANDEALDYYDKADQEHDQREAKAQGKNK
jgi:hypothetical protein